MFDSHLNGVEKPGRYIGLEVNAYRKSFESASVRFALAFPDVYEIGLSDLGMRAREQGCKNPTERKFERNCASRCWSSSNPQALSLGPRLFRSEFAHDGDGGGGADAVGAGFKQCADLGDSADAAGGFDAAACADDAAHECDIGGSSASRGKARRGVDEIRAGLNGDLRGAQLFLHGEQAGL